MLCILAGARLGLMASLFAVYCVALTGQVLTAGVIFPINEWTMLPVALILVLCAAWLVLLGSLALTRRIPHTVMAVLVSVSGAGLFALLGRELHRAGIGRLLHNPFELLITVCFVVPPAALAVLAWWPRKGPGFPLSR